VNYYTDGGTATPEGSGTGPGSSANVLPGAPRHGLVCGAGTSVPAVKVFIGSGNTFTAAATGTVFCTINEVDVFPMRIKTILARGLCRSAGNKENVWHSSSEPGLGRIELHFSARFFASRARMHRRLVSKPATTNPRTSISAPPKPSDTYARKRTSTRDGRAANRLLRGDVLATFSTRREHRGPVETNLMSRSTTSA